MNKWTSGIYRIENTCNGKVYIGQSVNLKQRRKWHFTRLRNNLHPSSHLQRAWNKYGEASFVFTLVETCPPEHLDALENAWIENTRSWDRRYGYNLDRCAKGTGPRTDITREKIRKSLRGRPVSEATRNKISATKKGIPGVPQTEEVRRRHSEAMKGRVFTEEHRRKLSEAKKGKVGNRLGSSPSPESRAKMSQAKKGRSLSEEHRRKIAEGVKRTLTQEEHAAPSE